MYCLICFKSGRLKKEDFSYSKLLLIFSFLQTRFYIDLAGNVRLRNIFILEKDKQFVYNLTISARDKSGLENFTSVAIFLNVMSIVNLNQPYPFECLINGARSELNLNERKTLNPPLYITVNFYDRNLLNLKNLYFIYLFFSLVCSLRLIQSSH